MNILFKYYNKLNMSYFDDPTIKISSTDCLNDPFERRIGKDLMTLTLQTIPDINSSPNHLNFKPIFNEITFLNLIGQIGIVSLTETPRNLLMWSHYANQHKGLCIGYKDDFLDHNKDKAHSILPTIFHPTKINYDNCRYDQYTDIFTSGDTNELRKQILLKTLLRKGDDWIYEKEHRSIIPMEFNDKIICIGNKNAYEYAHECEFLEAIDETHFKIKSNNMFYTSALTKRDDLVFAMNIKKESIVSIYFGCNSDMYENIELYEKIKDNPELSHIKCYLSSPSKNKFELDFTTIEDFIESCNEH